MRPFLKDFIKNNWIVVFISVILVCIPFFWLKPGEMDLGGDGGRLYFYDPVNQIKNLALYYVSPFGVGTVEASFYYLPFFTVVAVLKQIIRSPYVLISLNNAVKIAIGFVAVYAIVGELIRKVNKISAFGVRIVSVLAGLFYLFTPAMTENYVKALPSHNQVFLNPLMFYLLLRFFLTGSMKHAWIGLLISFIFAPNFSYTSAPPFFAFYPLAFLFIIIYSAFIRKVGIPLKKLFIVLSLFLGLHFFHLFPEIIDIFTSGSNTNLRLSASDIPAQIGYFYGVLHIPKTSFHLLAYSLTKNLAWASVLIPFIILFGLFLNKKGGKTILLVTIFFLTTFFLVTGKITMAGIKLYEWLFYLPGFTMFRNFYGQWQFVFYFFYSILFGLSLFSIFQKIKSKVFYSVLLVFFTLYFTVSSWHFINGGLVNPFREEAKNVKGAIIMDPKYDDTLAFIRNLKDDAKILVLPFTDSYIQVIHGLNDGAFVGHTTIGQLTGKKDFAGYMDMSPYSAKFWELSKEKDYEGIKKLLGILNIRYIFHNSDTRIYDTTFPARPYSQNYVRKYMPATQNMYKDYIKGISGQKIFERGFYSIYKIDDKSFFPHFYAPDKAFVYKDDPKLDTYSKASAFFIEDTSQRPLFMEDQDCKRLFAKKLCNDKVILMENNLPKIQFKIINPTKYKIRVSNAKNPYLLAFLDAFNKRWKVYIPGKKIEGNFVETLYDKMFGTIGMRTLPDSTHFSVNGYANAWYISPQDLDNEKDYELIVEMVGQRIFYISLGISTAVFIGFLLWGVYLFGIIKKLVGTFDKIIARR